MKTKSSNPLTSRFNTLVAEAILSAILFALISGFSTNAALLAYEPFSNAPGTSIIGSSDGFGFTGSWLDYNSSQGTATNTSVGLSYTDSSGLKLETTGGAGFFQGLTTANNSMQPIRQFNFSRGADGSTTWISFLAVRQGPTVAGSNPYPRGANVCHDVNSGNVQKLAVGNSTGATSNRVALIPQGSASNLKPSDVPFSQVNLIVVRIDHVASANDNAYLFINHSLDAEPLPAQADAVSLGEFDFSFDRLRVFAGGNDTSNDRPYAELILDEYRLGETYTDVTPHLNPDSLVITNTMLTPGYIVLSGTGGSNNAPYQLLASPTLSVSSTEWPAVLTNYFASDGSFALTNPLPGDVLEQFYRLRQIPPMIPPFIDVDLVDLSIYEGENATLSVTAGGSPALHYRWYFNAGLLEDSINASYTISSAQTNDAGNYFVVVSNDYGTVTSRVATLTVDVPPVLLPGAYFVSPSGSDSNDGSEEYPFLTITKGLNTITTSGTLYLRGGTYAQSSDLSLDRTATSNGAIRVWAYPGESPVIDSTGSYDGISISGTGYHLKGLAVINAGHNGIRISGHYNTVEACTLRENGNTGLHITGSEFPSYNLILNCDSYLNYDPENNGENADGFTAKWDLGPGNVFRGCRAWSNSDDGWDLWMGNSSILIEECWAFWNGIDHWNTPSFAGDGNGIKLGGNNIGAPHRVLRCLTFENVHHGIDQNNNTDGQTIDQNTSWNNDGKNFYLDHGANTTPHVVRNNVSFDGGTSDTFTAGTIFSNNSWQVVTSPGVNDSDMLSVDSTGADGPRNPDGSLPDLPFLHPVPEGRLVDQGVDIGEPYNGTAPDLGAFETEP